MTTEARLEIVSTQRYSTYHDLTMNDFTPLTRPLQSQVTIDPIAKDCPSEGFNVYQHFSSFFIPYLKYIHSTQRSLN